MLRSWWARRRYNRPLREPFVTGVLPRGGVGAELGIYRGEFTRELLDLTLPSRLHIVDPWYLLGPEWHWGKSRVRSTIGALQGVLGEFSRELVSGQVVLHVGDDLEVIPTFPDRYFDWVYIDSVHAYEHTRRELELLDAKMKPGGIIAGDDWIEDPDHPHHGVTRAVLEFVARTPYEVVYASTDDLQWAIRA